MQLSPELTTSPTAQYGTTTESLEKQFEIVKKETTTSHVSQYGQMVSRGGEEKREEGRRREGRGGEGEEAVGSITSMFI